MEANKNTKNDKVMGLNGMTVELLKCGSESLTEWMEELFR